MIIYLWIIISALLVGPSSIASATSQFEIDLEKDTCGPGRQTIRSMGGRAGIQREVGASAICSTHICERWEIQPTPWLKPMHSLRLS
jgi:hypothetical protein